MRNYMLRIKEISKDPYITRYSTFVLVIIHNRLGNYFTLYKWIKHGLHVLLLRLKQYSFYDLFHFQVTYKADSLNLDFLKLAQNGNPMFSVIGEVEWQCRDIGPGMPLPYTSDGDNYAVIYFLCTHLSY